MRKPIWIILVVLFLLSLACMNAERIADRMAKVPFGELKDDEEHRAEMRELGALTFTWLWEGGWILVVVPLGALWLLLSIANRHERKKREKSEEHCDGNE